MNWREHILVRDALVRHDSFPKLNKALLEFCEARGVKANLRFDKNNHLVLQLPELYGEQRISANITLQEIKSWVQGYLTALGLEQHNQP